MNRVRGKNLFWILLITMLILNLWTVVPSKAQEDMYPTDVSIQPPSISWTYPEHDLLETFEVTLYIHNVTDLWAWQAGLYFNPNVLNVTYFNEGPFLKQGGATFLMPSGTIDNTTGVIPFFASFLREPANPVSGSGDLAYIGFQVINYGYSTLDLITTDDDPAELVLSDFNLNEIPCDVYDGYFELPPPVHDIAITSVTPSSTWVYQGNTIDIYVEVKNKGDFSETFNVTAYHNSTAIQTQTVTNLNPNANKTLILSWNTTDVSLGNYTISASAGPVSGETYITDNTLIDGTVQIRIPGDIDGDGDVDKFDFGLFAGAYGSKAGEPEYITGADLDHDGDVDKNDFGMFAGNFGKST